MRHPFLRQDAGTRGGVGINSYTRPPQCRAGRAQILAFLSAPTARCALAVVTAILQGSRARSPRGRERSSRTQGIHRGLGVHISKVRSCALDKWTPELLANMENIGNARGNAYWWGHQRSLLLLSQCRRFPHKMPRPGCHIGVVRGGHLSMVPAAGSTMSRRASCGQKRAT